MNTPDQGPKDGDFVAYLEELERQQLRAHRPTGAATSVAPASHAGPQAPSASLPPAAAVAIARSIPVGLVVIGVALLIAGALVDGGFFLALIGILLLAQAARTVMKAAAVAAKDAAAHPAQQMAGLLAAHAQRKTPPAK